MVGAVVATAVGLVITQLPDWFVSNSAAEFRARSPDTHLPPQANAVDAGSVMTIDASCSVMPHTSALPSGHHAWVFIAASRTTGSRE